MLATLVRFLGPEAALAVDYIDTDWAEEPFSGGCYCAVFLPGHLVDYGGMQTAACGWTVHVLGQVRSSAK